MQLRIGFQASLKVSFQIRLSDHLTIRRPQELCGSRRDQLDCIFIVRHDLVQIMSVPGRNPMLRQFPSVFYRHGNFSSTWSSLLPGRIVRRLCRLRMLEELAFSLASARIVGRLEDVF